jgi:hypothetical protein
MLAGVRPWGRLPADARKFAVQMTPRWARSPGRSFSGDVKVDDRKATIG